MTAPVCVSSDTYQPRLKRQPSPSIKFEEKDTDEERLTKGYKVLRTEFISEITESSNAYYYLAGGAVTLIATIAAYTFGQIVLFGLGMGLTVALVFKARELNTISKMDGYNKAYFNLTQELGEKLIPLIGAHSSSSSSSD